MFLYFFSHVSGTWEGNRTWSHGVSLSSWGRIQTISFRLGSRESWQHIYRVLREGAWQSALGPDLQARLQSRDEGKIKAGISQHWGLEGAAFLSSTLSQAITQGQSPHHCISASPPIKSTEDWAALSPAPPAGRQLWMGREGDSLCLNRDTQASRDSTGPQTNRQNQECSGGRATWHTDGLKRRKIFKGFAPSQSFNVINVSAWWTRYIFIYLCIIFLPFFPFFLWRHLKTSNCTEMHQCNWSHTSKHKWTSKAKNNSRIRNLALFLVWEQNTKHTFIRGQSLLH